MAKLTKIAQKIFGVNAGTNQISKFGSLAAGAPAFTTDADEVQSLSNYLDGWFGGVLGNSPSIEDMNGLHFLFSRQLAYLMQAGVPEWDAATTYYIDSLVNVNGVIYRSIVDDNLNNATSDATKWTIALSRRNPTVQQLTSGTGVYTTPAGALYLKVRMVGGGAGGESGITAGSGTSNEGSSGENTTFSDATAQGGSGGGYASHYQMGGPGGSADAGSHTLIIDVTGGKGSSPETRPHAMATTASGGFTYGGGSGGNSPLGSCGNPQYPGSTAGGNGSGYGAGGGGGYASGSTANLPKPGAGGGAGGYVEFFINNPQSSYAYAVGAGGVGGDASTGGGKGGDGSDGIIIIEEYYQ